VKIASWRSGLWSRESLTALQPEIKAAAQGAEMSMDNDAIEEMILDAIERSLAEEHRTVALEWLRGRLIKARALDKLLDESSLDERLGKK
jgi:hypothetical protein